MTPEAANHIARARDTLIDARTIASLPLPHIAARECYLAVFHAAQAYIVTHTGKAAKTHRGVRSEFARLAQQDSRLSRDLVRFLVRAYSFKSTSDYGIGPLRDEVTPSQANEAVSMASRFGEAIAEVLEIGGQP